ncbi:hypothetical protein C0W59_03205, partial [Photobacterium kishitanii]
YIFLFGSRRYNYRITSIGISAIVEKEYFKFTKYIVFYFYHKVLLAFASLFLNIYFLFYIIF